jgi:hypothetical protein
MMNDERVFQYFEMVILEEGVEVSRAAIASAKIGIGSQLLSISDAFI